jgi:hypothetical protein
MIAIVLASKIEALFGACIPEWREVLRPHQLAVTLAKSKE